MADPAHTAPDSTAEPPSIAPAVTPALQPDALALRLRGVHRAIADLRRGVPVVLRVAAHPGEARALVLLPAETAGARGLAEFARLADAPPCLLLAPARAAGVLRRPLDPDQGPVAIALPSALPPSLLDPALLDPAVLRGLADPTAEQLLPEQPQTLPAPPGAGAALALAKLARLLPAVLAAPTSPEAMALAAAMHLLTLDEAAVLAYPGLLAGSLVRVAEAAVPLDGAPDARVVAFRAADAGIEHLAIVIGQPQRAAAPLVRLHSECFTGDLLGSLRCDCGPQLREAIARMAAEGAGVLLYLAQEGRGIGLVNKLRAYALQDRGQDTLDANRALGWGADERSFLIAATMLAELGIRRVRLLTNNPAKLAALTACGVEVVGRERHVIEPNGVNDFYLQTKAMRFGHLLG